MSKICTNIFQSKKLIELEIDINTTDMCWQNNVFSIGFNDDDGAAPGVTCTVCYKGFDIDGYIQKLT